MTFHDCDSWDDYEEYINRNNPPYKSGYDDDEDEDDWGDGYGWGDDE